MKRKVKIRIVLVVLILLLVPALAAAESKWGLIPCDNSEVKCDFKAFMVLINTLINFILFKLAVPVAAIMFAYAGFSMVVPGGESAHARTKAKHIFTNAVIGLALAAAAWILIKTLLTILGYTSGFLA